MALAAAPMSFPSSAPPDLLQAALEISLTGFIAFRPIYDPAHPATITDLAYVYLNPAAQRMLQLPGCPAESFLTRYPSAVEAGIFAFYRDTFLAGAPGRFVVSGQHEGLDNAYQLAAHRAGDLLVVSFSETADQPRPAGDEALRQSQAAGDEARAEAEAQRQRLLNVFLQDPVLMAQLRGPDHLVELANHGFEGAFGHRGIQGRTYREAAPELVAQGFIDLLDRVYQTGETFSATEQPAYMDDTNTGTPQLHYHNFIYQATRNAAGTIDGILIVATDVTELVLNRQQLEEKERHTAQLNQELEARVQARTQEAEAVAQRLQHVTESLPNTIFTADAAGQVLYISPQWYAYTGMALGTPVSEAWPDFIYPADLPAISKEFNAALAEGRPWSYEFRLRGADGHYRWFASQGVPEPLAEAEAAGRLRQWFGSNFDVDDLKRVQQRFEEQDQLLTNILSSLPAGVVTFEGEDLRFGFFNEAYQQLAEGRVVLGRPAVEVFPEVAEQGFLASLREVLRTGEPYRGQEVPAYARDPRTGQQQDMYLDLAYLPLRHGQQAPHAVLGFLVDVTGRVLARQQAEAAQALALAAAGQVAAQREAFFQVFEQTPARIALLCGPHHGYEYVNPAYQQLFAGRELVGRPMAEAIPEVRGQGFLEMLDHVFQTGETSFSHELLAYIPQPDGQPPQERYFDSTYQAIREDGLVAGISVFAYDVTERVLARRQRESQRVQLAELFEQAPAAVAILGGPGLVHELVNPIYASLFPGRELPGRALADVFPELAGTGVVESFEQVYQTGLPNEEKCLLIPFTNPATGQLEDRYFNYSQQARRDAQDRIDGVLVFAFEVTEQVSARQHAQALAAELTTANQQLVRINADLDNFIYTASHDLKAPISNLEGLLYLLQEELPAEVAQNAEVGPVLARMLDAVDRFKRTIDHLTDVSKLQKEHQSAATLVNLAAVVEDVRQDLQPVLEAAGAKLFVAVSATPSIPFTEKNLRSIVYNLLSNAVKYRHPDRTPHIDVRAHVRAGHTVLEVHDNGLGLGPAHLPRLFTMFQRFHNHVEGTGIGLYMINRMVENAGGRIEVHSQLGAGSTFFVFLPHENGPTEQSFPAFIPA
ncbi:PAS domain-containing protein [Hymenobacter lapidiphilus]|uniref:histidine kinase n=1 Tax=Hymenobacter lapidiphilus TaxID=2608003 RepID=A0A7Y7PRI3_9BACT|nr:PAS domain-containing protein [Hymenobacter lapidiphilus]NVO32721.1 PAS domain-containing protein [Hymenobacter lapidiphilus]